MKYIEFVNVNYKYKRSNFSLSNINLDITKENITAIVGHNGSGKTTLGKLMCGIFKPDSGSILIDGKETKDMSLGQIGKKIGYLFQNPQNQIFSTTVYEELTFALEFKSVDKEEVEYKANKMLELFYIKHVKDSLPYKLSQGEKKRLALAAMLINNPEFLILDEPTTGLDVKRINILSDVLDNLKKEKEIGMVIISHDKDFIDYHADRIIKMSKGDIIDDKWIY